MVNAADWAIGIRRPTAIRGQQSLAGKRCEENLDYISLAGFILFFHGLHSISYFSRLVVLPLEDLERFENTEAGYYGIGSRDCRDDVAGHLLDIETGLLVDAKDVRSNVGARSHKVQRIDIILIEGDDRFRRCTVACLLVLLQLCHGLAEPVQAIIENDQILLERPDFLIVL